MKNNEGRSVNRKRGVQRLAVATLLPYFLFWLFVGLVNWQQKGLAEADLGNVQAGASIDYDLERLASADWWLYAAIRWGVIIPVIAAIVGAVAWWVYRGFKPKGEV